MIFKVSASGYPVSGKWKAFIGGQGAGGSGHRAQGTEQEATCSMQPATNIFEIFTTFIVLLQLL